MLEIALILSEYDSTYDELAVRFLEHFAWINVFAPSIHAHD